VNSRLSKEELNLPLIYPYKSANKPLSAPVLLHFMVAMGTEYASTDRDAPAWRIKMSRTLHILRIHRNSLKERKKTLHDNFCMHDFHCCFTSVPASSDQQGKLKEATWL